MSMSAVLSQLRGPPLVLLHRSVNLPFALNKHEHKAEVDRAVDELKGQPPKPTQNNPIKATCSILAAPPGRPLPAGARHNPPGRTFSTSAVHAVAAPGSAAALCPTCKLGLADSCAMSSCCPARLEASVWPSFSNSRPCKGGRRYSTDLRVGAKRLGLSRRAALLPAKPRLSWRPPE